MTRATVLRATLGTLAVVAIVAVPARAVDAASDPLVALGQASVELGGQLNVTGAGWGLDGNMVHVEVCGNNAINRSRDCALASSVNAALRNEGEFGVRLTIAQPPAPCPCVVRVTSLTTSIAVNEPIDIVGAPVADLDISGVLPSRAVSVTEMRYQPSHSMTSVFGGSLQGTLHVTVRSSADVVIRDPALALGYGRDADPTGFIAALPVGDLAPGQEKTIEVPMSFDALSAGTYRIAASIDPLAPAEIRTIEYTVIPWGLVAIAVVVVNIVLWLTVRRFVRRSDAEHGVEARADEPLQSNEPVLTGTRVD